eukprot:1831792-Pyramimonas_sp.AAC.1
MDLTEFKDITEFADPADFDTMEQMQDKRKSAHVWLGEDGIPCYDGDAASAEWDERVRLGFLGAETAEKKKSFIAK